MKTTAIVLADSEGVIRAWNEGAQRLFGYDAADAIGQSLDLIVPEQYRERHWAGFRAAMISGKPKLDRPAGNLPVLRSDGTVGRLPGRLYFLTDALDRPVGAMGIFAPGDGADASHLPDV